MKRIPRLLRAMAIASAVIPCWLIGGAAPQEPAPREPAQATDSVADRFAVSHFTTQDLALSTTEPAKEIKTELVLDGQSQRLVMHPYSLRAKNMVVLAQMADGQLHYMEPPAPRTYRGTVEGVPGSLVAASLGTDGSLSGAVRVGGDVWGFQPLRTVQPDAPANRTIVYRQQDVQMPKGVCGTIAPPERQPPPDEGGIAGSTFSGGVQADIAFDADFEFYQQNASSVPLVTSDIENLYNIVEAMYLNEVGIVFRITAVIVRTTEPDPYSTTNPGTLLNQLANQWNLNHGNIVRDMVELMTGKDLDGGTIGIATQATACVNPSSAYHLTQSKFSFNLLHRAHLSGHETAHNLSAGHCDGAPDCGLMCSIMGNCGGDILGWGGGSGPTVIAWRNSPPCLAAFSTVGACCVGSTCTQVSQAECITAGGTWTVNTPCTTRLSYSTAPGTAIPDGNPSGITSTINVPESYPVGDVNVQLNIPHTWIGDVIVELQHNGGPFIRIIDRMGFPQTQFGCDANNIDVILDDEAGPAGSIENVCSPFFPFQQSPGFAPSSGPPFVPNASLSFFNGQNAQGTWTLRVIDVATPDTGSLASWGMSIQNANTGLCLPTGSCCVGSTCNQTIQSVCQSSGGVWTSGQACFQSLSSTSNPNVLIPDNNAAGVSNNLIVGTAFPIHDLNVKLVISHAYIGDLIVKLSHNGGPQVILIDRPGVPASAFGCDGDNLNIILDDEGVGGSVENLCGNPTNPSSPPNFVPLNPLSFFDGQNMNGTWTLNVSDVIPLNAGTLVQWGLIGEDNETNVCVDPCPADITGNNVVDVDDLLAVISGWGLCPAPPTPCPANVATGSGSAGDVDVDDLLAVISAWGPCP